MEKLDIFPFTREESFSFLQIKFRDRQNVNFTKCRRRFLILDERKVNIGNDEYGDDNFHDDVFEDVGVVDDVGPLQSNADFISPPSPGYDINITFVVRHILSYISVFPKQRFLHDCSIKPLNTSIKFWNFEQHLLDANHNNCLEKSDKDVIKLPLKLEDLNLTSRFLYLKWCIHCDF